MPDRLDRIVRFGVFEVDARSGELRKAGRRVALQDQPCRLLIRLLTRPGELVTREELRAELWPSDTFVDFDQGLNAAVKRLREALGDSAESPRFIETIPRRGYRFVAPVTPSQKAAPRPSRVPARALSTAVLVIAGAAAIGIAWPYVRSAPRASEAPRTLAVLPFRPIVADTGDAALELGVTDTLINQISQISSVMVRPLSAVRRYGALDQDPIAAGRALGVDAVVEGSIQQAADTTRVTVRLLDVRDGSTRLAFRQEAPATGLFALQDAIAERVAASLSITLTETARKALTRRGTASPQAYLAYQRGRYHLWRRTNRDNRRAVELFQEALALDSDYAQAYAGLADAYAQLVGQVGAEPHELMPKAREMALRALRLDDSLAEAHTSLAAVLAQYDFDYAAAEKEHLRAIALSPHDLAGLFAYGITLRAMGRFDEALVQFERARLLDPLSLDINRNIAHVHYSARRFDAAIDQSLKTLDLDPNFAAGYWVLARAYEAEGLRDQAIEAHLKLYSLDPDSTEEMVQTLRDAYTSAGWTGFWRKRLELAYKPVGNVRASFHRAEIHVRLGDTEEALRLLEQAYEERSSYLHQLANHTVWDGLRSDPRFQNILQRARLSP